jgi:DNA polymerase-3 subunit delta
MPVYALVGSDSFLQMEALSRLLAQMPDDAQRIDVEGDRAELAAVLDELRSFSLFGAGKVVVVRNADEFVKQYREKLEDYLAKPSDSATLVVRMTSLPTAQRIHKLIAKIGKIEPCVPPKPGALPKWIIDRAKAAHQVKIAPDAANMLAQMVGDDLGRLDNELAKLALQAASGVVTAKDVATGVAFQREQEMWDMTNELAAGHPDKALKRWRQLVQLDSSAEYRAVTWLGMWLENVRGALAMKRQGMSPPAIAQALRLWPREMQQGFFKTTDALGEAGVARAIRLLATIDKQSKSGIGEMAENVERFILSIAVK